MKTFVEDINSELNQVDRWWLRIPIAIISSVIMLAAGIIIDIFGIFYNIYKEWFLGWVIPVFCEKPFPEDE